MIEELSTNSYATYLSINVMTSRANLHIPGILKFLDKNSQAWCI